MSTSLLHTSSLSPLAPLPSGSECGPTVKGKESPVSLPRSVSAVALALLAVSFLAPAATATLVDRTVFAEEFGFST